MKVLVLGADGYLGWPLSLRLAIKGHEVMGIDNLATRRAVEEIGSNSAFPLPSPQERVKEAKRILGVNIDFSIGDITNKEFLREAIKSYKPDAVVHFAEQRSAPYSMKDLDHAVYTVRNNLESTLNLIYLVKDIDPSIHILKMGTMGEYGTPNFDIPESPFVDAIVNGKNDKIFTPRWGGSVYHMSKIFDSYFLAYFNRIFNLTITDIMQGPVYGTRTSEIVEESLRTRFDFDETWGTVVNRFCVEAILGIPLTPYGKGGQTRGFLSLEDSINALTLLLENPPKREEYRVVNQFMEIYSINEIAEIVKRAGEDLGLDVTINHVENPRVEAEEHYYNPERKVLPTLGYKPKKNLAEEVKIMIEDLIPYKDRLERYKTAIMPKTKWKS
ncbi:UDP-sulfoquinovose synthase [Acidianus sp. RZ1]|uniref:UDP-sulfoquinovose synthase n=1 Tax=Acidianus sp. RZ1 TaxID=1540082 RepID=UPI001492BC5E|nr:UDP-sulfoquinovose synthase [Acidianus sp. RZ1]NON61246.1 NAD-dependent epimerase/dehydratase family protein [Acidianus sp. RZ1]